ncbi:carbohydrate-binding module family 50 protein [Zasmidium cellare ATCC 36951]|uniref:Carbohydrate-binding module family 50 protein n=1 Tax=Zasmidium cellare ATCC 36951 TaxID=1080233 RepID=A0A6A6CMD8_ZASCE|nr:carbohydrate-binding module family 50 protein [Zasmidium cellare ATCC 36951]KAF2167783.1 carbohydrate-binding module family 50 protein [Zasmidium cellare ATCC 36951]
MQVIVFTAALLSSAVSGYVLPRNTDCQTTCGSTSTTNYTIIAGDTLTTVAERYSSGICDIATLNNISNPNLVTPGQNLLIPTNCTTPDNDSCLDVPADPTETCVKGLGSTYDVRSGDTLSAIATSFNITLPAIVDANPQIADIDVIEVGQIINVPVCPSSQCEIVGTYNIVSGDLFYDLASTYHTTVGQILALNVGVDPTTLVEGQQIILPQGCQNVTTAVA